MANIAVVIETKDRRLTGGTNYLGQTLRNLTRAKFWDRPALLHSFQIVCGGELPDFIDTEIEPNLPAGTTVIVDECPPEGRTRQQNAAVAIRNGAETSADWVLKLEDDLDFIDDFLGATMRWLTKYGNAPSPMFVLGCAMQKVCDSHYDSPEETILKPGPSFPTARERFNAGNRIVGSSVMGFWGAQALAWKRPVAHHLADFLGDDPYLQNKDGKQFRDRGHDLLLQVWGNYIGAKLFAVAVPSFVQHIGRQSNINNRFFQFPWPGPDWTYDEAPVDR